MARVQFQMEARHFSSHHSVKTGFGAHPASYTMGTGALSQEVKWQGCEAYHSPSSSAKVKKDEAVPPLPNMSSWHGNGIFTCFKGDINLEIPR
jgi:hypothetical protein